MERRSQSGGGDAEHTLVRQTRRALESVDAQLAELERKHAKEAELRRKGVPVEPDWGALSMRDTVREGGVIRPENDVANVVVTKATRGRALALLALLIGKLADRGLKVWVEEGKTLVGLQTKKLHLVRHTFELRISEIVEKSASAPEIPYAPPGWIPTGRLRVTVRYGPRGDFRIRDEDDLRVELQVDALVGYIKGAVADAPERERDAIAARAARAAEVAAARASEAELAQAAAEEQRMLEIDAAHSEDLGREAAAWREANDIRAYSAALLARSRNDDKVAIWCAWAMRMADALDPSLRRLTQIAVGPAPAEPSPD